MQTIANYAKYADLQLAAEAFLLDLNGVPETGEQYVTKLMNGNNHASRFTRVQATEFAAHWEVLHQTPNSTTGFSGTLFRNKDTDELVLSFRSTEFIDDAARDNQATNLQEIATTGFAWGQLRDMEAWYQSLKDRGLLSEGQSFDVTGYSLGGHLATAFNLMHGPQAPLADRAPIGKVVTFNGAGVGTFDPAIGLKQVLDRFASQAASGPVIGDAALGNAYASAKAALQAGQSVSNADLSILQSMAHPLADSGVSIDAQTQVLARRMLDAITRVTDIRTEVSRLRTIGSGDGKSPAVVPDELIAQEGLDYQMAVLDVATQSSSASLMAGVARSCTHPTAPPPAPGAVCSMRGTATT